MNLPKLSSNEAVAGPRVVMLGPPGSGKGTHARMLAERFNIAHLSTGALLRREIAAGSLLGVRVATAVEAGQLVDDLDIVDLVRRAITSPAAENGWILDGAPRSVEQAPVFEAAGVARVIAIALDVSESELRRRLAERRTREGRTDDEPEIVVERFKVWAATGTALLDWYERSGTLRIVNGMGTPQAVASKVLEAVEHETARTSDRSPSQ